jgi:hypothetical protein
MPNKVFFVLRILHRTILQVLTLLETFFVEEALHLKLAKVKYNFHHLSRILKLTLYLYFTSISYKESVRPFFSLLTILWPKINQIFMKTQ